MLCDCMVVLFKAARTDYLFLVSPWVSLSTIASRLLRRLFQSLQVSVAATMNFAQMQTKAA